MIGRELISVLPLLHFQLLMWTASSCWHDIMSILFSSLRIYCFVWIPHCFWIHTRHSWTWILRRNIISIHVISWISYKHYLSCQCQILSITWVTNILFLGTEMSRINKGRYMLLEKMDTEIRDLQVLCWNVSRLSFTVSTFSDSFLS